MTSSLHAWMDRFAIISIHRPSAPGRVLVHLHDLLARPAETREAPLDGDCCGAVEEVPASVVEPNRLAALRALVALEDDQVQPLLTAALDDPNPHVQAFARQAVAQVDAAGAKGQP